MRKFIVDVMGRFHQNTVVEVCQEIAIYLNGGETQVDRPACSQNEAIMELFFSDAWARKKQHREKLFHMLCDQVPKLSEMMCQLIQNMDAQQNSDRFIYLVNFYVCLFDEDQNKDWRWESLFRVLVDKFPRVDVLSDFISSCDGSRDAFQLMKLACRLTQFNHLTWDQISAIDCLHPRVPHKKACKNGFFRVVEQIDERHSHLLFLFVCELPESQEVAFENLARLLSGAQNFDAAAFQNKIEQYHEKVTRMPFYK